MPKSNPVDTTAAGLEAAKQLGLPLGEDVETETETETEVETQTQDKEREGETGEDLETDEKPLTEDQRQERHRGFQARINQLYREKKDLERVLTQLVGQIDKITARGTPAQERVEEDPNFDLMTNTELARHSRKELLKFKDEILGAVKGQFGEVVGKVDARGIAEDIKVTTAKYKDFRDYLPEMIELSERHPTLNAEEVYLLASGNLGAVKKSVANRLKGQINKKKAARTETRSSIVTQTGENKQFKSVKEAGYAAARKLGMIT